jgi:predicted nucleotidyltransferase
VDGSTHELCKYVMLLLKSNGNYLEILYAPEVLVTTPLHHEIRELARGCFTRLLGEHYRGMAQNQQRGMRSNTLKSLLHHYRCLLMGIHVLRTGELEPNVYRLGELYGEEGLRELADIKRAGGMHPGITADDVTEHGMRLARLEARLAEEEERSALPREPSATTHRAFNDLLERVRLEQLGVRTGRRDA